MPRAIPHRPARRLASVAILTLVLAACATPTAPQQELAAAKRRWAMTAPAAYEITVSRSCECRTEVTRPTIVTVRGGAVESRRYADTGVELSPEWANAYPTVDQMFAIVDDALAQGAAQLIVTYDPERGFPLSISIDYHARLIDDEVVFLARNFVVR